MEMNSPVEFLITTSLYNNHADYINLELMMSNIT